MKACSSNIKILGELTWAAVNIFWTASEISGPMPSPGISVQVLLPEALYCLTKGNAGETWKIKTF